MANLVKGVKITYETEHSVSSWESPYLGTPMDNILEGFFGMCVAQGWQPVTVISGMQQFAKDHGYILQDDAES